MKALQAVPPFECLMPMSSNGTDTSQPSNESSKPLLSWVIFFRVKVTICSLNMGSSWLWGRVTLVPSIRIRGVKVRLAVLSVHHGQGPCPSTRISIVENLHSEVYVHALLRNCEDLFVRSEFSIWGEIWNKKETSVTLPAQVWNPHKSWELSKTLVIKRLYPGNKSQTYVL